MRTDLGKLVIRLLASGFKTSVRGRVCPSEQKRYRGDNFPTAVNQAPSLIDGYQGTVIPLARSN